jgi:Putative zinc-finger
MKPCSKNRKRIAWLALGALDAESAEALREHFEHCDGCRGYANELSNVTATLTTAEMQSDIEATASFHRRVVAGIKAQEARPVWQSMREFLRAAVLNWRVAVPVVGGLTVLFVVGWFLIPREHPEALLPASSSAQMVSGREGYADFAPTVGNYYSVANRSLDSLDEVLTKEASRKVPSAPVYTASAFSTGSISD